VEFIIDDNPPNHKILENYRIHDQVELFLSWQICSMLIRILLINI